MWLKQSVATVLIIFALAVAFFFFVGFVMI